MKYKITIDDFTPVVPWEQIELVMGKRNYDKFVEWMEGQTVSAFGVYLCDLERFLKGKDSFRI